MLIYLAIFGGFAATAILNLWKESRSKIIAILIALFLTIFIGFRYAIGVDWVTYEIIFLDISRSSLPGALTNGDSAYSLVNWIVSRASGQIWHVNLLCAALFSIALVRFCDLLPRPGLAITAAVPTLIIVTAMGYTRQATAVGCIMFAFNSFRGGINWRWLGWLSLGVLFHKSAIFVLPIFILSGSRNRWLTIITGVIVGVGFLTTIIASTARDVLSLYFEGDITSSGTMPRVAAGAIVGLSYFAIRRDENPFGERNVLVRNMALALVLMFPLYFIIPSTTVVDRIGILLLPFQSAIVAGLAFSYRKNILLEKLITWTVVAFYLTILMVWLLFATFADFWIPYENVLFLRWI